MPWICQNTILNLCEEPKVNTMAAVHPILAEPTESTSVS